MSVEAAVAGGAELILVNDGSTDNTATVFSQVTSTWPRSSLVTQPWAGLGAARNVGLLHASGPYVMFLDSDDYLYPEGLERLLFSATASGAPVCRGREARHEFGSDPQQAHGSGRFRWMDSRKALLSGFGGTLRYIYRKEFLVRGGIAYPTHLPFAEDLPFAAEVAARIRQFPDVDFTLYSYQVGRPGQLTAANRSETWPNLVESFLECEKRVGPHSPEIRSAVGALEWWYALRGLPQASEAATTEVRATLRTFASGASERLGVSHSAIALDVVRILALRSLERVQSLLGADA